MRLFSLIPTMILLAYEGEDDAAKAAAEAARLAAEAEANKNKKTTFTQEDVNKFLAEEKRKAKAQSEKLAMELEALKGKANLSAQEREELEGRIEALRTDYMTKEELLKQEKEKESKKYKTELDAKTKEAEAWRNRFTQDRINRSITDAAVSEKAFSPKQIVAQLAANARLVEVLDDANKPTGDFVAKVKITDKDKDGKDITLDLTVHEAVKKMSEQEDFANLFQGKGTGGAGGQNRGGGRAPDAATLAGDPAAYRAARKAGKLPL